MNNRAHAADARRLDKTRAKDRHRNPVEVQIEKNSGVHKEGARKELAYVLPRNPSNHIRLLLMFLIEWIHRYQYPKLKVSPWEKNNPLKRGAEERERHGSSKDDGAVGPRDHGRRSSLLRSSRERTTTAYDSG